MPIIRLQTDIGASPERCFDLARDVAAHVRSTTATNERPVGPITTGLLGLGDEVTWEARHFGIQQRLTARITVYERPRRFVDEMVRGAFARLRHEHLFEPRGAATRMTDVFDYTPPLGLLGRMADAMFLRSYLRRFLAVRAGVLKDLAERSPPDLGCETIPP
jgi:ligand-binding SRPBCC domain-containing protein